MSALVRHCSYSMLQRKHFFQNLAPSCPVTLLYSLQSHFYPLSTWQVLIPHPILDTYFVYLMLQHAYCQDLTIYCFHFSQQDSKLGMPTGKLALYPDRKMNLIPTQTTNLPFRRLNDCFIYIGCIYVCRHMSKMFHRIAVWTAYLKPTEVQMVFMEFDATRRKSQDVNESPGILNWNSAQTARRDSVISGRKRASRHKPRWSRLSLRLTRSINADLYSHVSIINPNTNTHIQSHHFSISFPIGICIFLPFSLNLCLCV